MAKKTKQEAEKTRKNIMLAGLNVFSDKGVSRSSLAEIGEAAQVTRGAVYWHFKNKIDLLQAIYDDIMSPLASFVDEQIQSSEKTPLELLNHLCQQLLIKIVQDTYLRQIFLVMYEKLERNQEVEPIWERYEQDCRDDLDLLTHLFEGAQQLGELKHGIEPKLAALGCHSYLVGLLEKYVVQPPEAQVLTEQARQLFDIYFSGLSANR
ncbi:TetR family transcriptional regulator [Vibrio sp. S4M6]|uniref:TetR family transcriptional regulator n=1 Tax=Vibrio sinus TaxID=2946865 RepID=UPI002029C923|nr:TetR family transcriptional regulator [Vibrio sinus]MCL9780691.1 TetR family transcriptional regulator [Vibrio sinus]